MSKPAWSWADYERCKRREERRAKRAAAEISSVQAQGVTTADSASGCEGRAAEVSIGPAPAKVAASPHVAVKARQSRTSLDLRKAYHAQLRAQIKPSNCGAVSVLGAKIDISAAPSGMEAAAERWRGKGPAPMALAPVPELCAGFVMCRCGSRASGKGRGPVPVWFGEKCIENNCELRARRGDAADRQTMRGMADGR